MTDTPGNIERPPHHREDQTERTEMGQAGPTYEDYPTGTDVGFPTEPPPPLEPVPVVVVGVPAETTLRTAWRAYTATVGGTGTNAERPVQLVGTNTDRTRVVIRNLNAVAGNSVYLVPDNTTPPGDFGYELQPQAELELLHNGSVWAVCIVGQSARVGVSAEQVLGDDV